LARPVQRTAAASGVFVSLIYDDDEDDDDDESRISRRARRARHCDMGHIHLRI